MGELTMGLAQYFAYYNAERPHQSLGYQTAVEVYLSGCGGGARIVDRFSGELADSPARNRGSAVQLRVVSMQLKLRLSLS